MAYSQTEHKAQSCTVCQICQESPDLKWKCIECELIFCHNCKIKFHSKSRSLSEHHVFDLKDWGTETAIDTIRQTALKTIICPVHAGKKSNVFCKDCSITICTNCIRESHRYHDFCDINEVYEEKLTKITEYQIKYESNVTFYSEKEEKLQQKISTGQKHYKKIKKSISKKEYEITNAVRIHSKKLLSEVDSHWKSSGKIFLQQLAAVQQTKEELELTKSEFNVALQSFDASKILTANIHVNEQLMKKDCFTLANLKNNEFIKGHFSESAIHRMFGHVYSGPKFELVESHETSIKSSPSKILVLDKHSTVMLIASWGNQLQMVQLNHLQVGDETEKQAVFDMDMMQNGTDIIFSEKGCDLKIFTLNNLSEIETFHSFCPFITLGVHVCKDNYILVGIAESASFLMPKTDSMNRIMILNTEGEVEMQHEFDANNQRLFTKPIRIKTDSDNNIYVVDIINKSLEGRVVSIDWIGSLRWIYTGAEIFEKMFPREVEVASTGTILVSDEYNHAIHLLSQEGIILGCKTLEDVGIKLPCCLHLVNNEALWISCRKEDKNSHAKLHLLNLK